SLPLLTFFFFLYSSAPLRDLHSFPTRRSSDLDRRSGEGGSAGPEASRGRVHAGGLPRSAQAGPPAGTARPDPWHASPREDAEGRSEEHTSELQSRFDLVCRLLLEKKNIETQER